MTRDEAITLAGSLAISLQTASTLDTFANDVMHELALRPSPPFVKAAVKALTSGTATYSFESDMLKLVHAIMEDEILSPVSQDSLDAYSASWTTATGTPVAFTQDEITARTYLLYPIPDFTSDAVAGPEPLGEDWPNDSLVLIYSDDRESDIPNPFGLPIAFDSLSREFAYPSDHTDTDFSTACTQIAQLLYQLLEPR